VIEAITVVSSSQSTSEDDDETFGDRRGDKDDEFWRHQKFKYSQVAPPNSKSFKTGSFMLRPEYFLCVITSDLSFTEL